MYLTQVPSPTQLHTNMQLAFASILSSFLVALAHATSGFPTSLLYQSPTGLFLENIAVRASSQLLITSTVSPTLHTLDPHTPNATLNALYTFPNATGLTGIAEYAPDVFAVVASVLNATSRTEEPGSVVIWRVDFTAHSYGPATQPIANVTPTNGLSAVPGLSEIILTADSADGAVYAVNMRSGDVSLVIRDVLLAPTATATLGINGLHVHEGFLYATNSGRGTFLRVPLAVRLGKGLVHATGPLEVIGVLQNGAPSNSHGFDDFAFDKKGRAWVTVHPGSLALFTPQKNGSWVQENAAGDPEGSDAVFVEPTAAAFGRGGGVVGKEKLYVTTAGGQIVVVDTGRAAE
ncbi:hypothetical protein C8F01DRAFT_671023 [Mycena amicta]|nr:hypothetical protein C8F01DRAFT_671023 [Mycena amicta]